jgi:hypothetical protein
MPGANNPFAAKAAAPLVNPITTASIFVPYAATPVINASPYSAYVKYDVYNNSVSTTSQAATNNAVGGQDSNMNYVRILVRAGGRVTGGTTTNFTPTLYFGRSTVTASNTSVGALTARAFNSASGAWYLDASLVWDATSGVISGTFSGLNGSTAAIDAAALITPVTGQTAAVLNAGQPLGSNGAGTFYFSIGALFSATNAANIALLDYFVVEDI